MTSMNNWGQATELEINSMRFKIYDLSMGASSKDVRSFAEGGDSNIAEKSGQGGGLAKSGHSLQSVQCKREEGI